MIKNIICRPRQSGRTTELIKRCAELNNAVIVCPTRTQADYVFKMSVDMNVKINYPTSFNDFCTRGCGYDTILIDNLDLCLQMIARRTRIDTVVLESED